MRLAIDQPHRLRSLCLFGSPVRGSGSGNADLIRAKGVRQWAADTMRSRLGHTASDAQVLWWTEELMGKTSARAAYNASASRIDMELENELSRIAARDRTDAEAESGLQSVEAVERYAARIPVSRVIVLPGDSYHIAAVERTFARGTRWNSCSVRGRAMQEGGGMTTRRDVITGLAACGAALPVRAWAQASYPSRPVRIVVPFAPGGGADIVSRLVQPHMQALLGQSVIVENRAGAAGRIGTASWRSPSRTATRCWCRPNPRW